jgi:hypothetical protein
MGKRKPTVRDGEAKGPPKMSRKEEGTWDRVAAIRSLEHNLVELYHHRDSLQSVLDNIKLPPGTVRWRYIDCGKCDNEHGPYLYTYKRNDGKLKEHYYGKLGTAAAAVRAAMEFSKKLRQCRNKIFKTEKQLGKVKAAEGAA